MFMENQSWWLAGTVGVVFGTVWNYAMTSVFTWRVKPVDTKVVSEE
jgi:dolichol-phosphate mannosyltransferase